MFLLLFFYVQHILLLLPLLCHRWADQPARKNHCFLPREGFLFFWFWCLVLLIEQVWFSFSSQLFCILCWLCSERGFMYFAINQAGLKIFHLCIFFRSPIRTRLDGRLICANVCLVIFLVSSACLSSSCLDFGVCVFFYFFSGEGTIKDRSALM